MKHVLVLLAILGMVSAASAAITVNVTPAANAPAAGLAAYDITLVSDQPMQSFDVLFTGSMNQLKTTKGKITPTYDAADVLADEDSDTHFNLYSSDILAVTFTESDTMLKGVFAFQTAVTTLDLATIVLPIGQIANLTGTCADSLGNKYDIPWYYPLVPPEPPAPAEPATLGLLAIGVAGLLRRKPA